MLISLKPVIAGNRLEISNSHPCPKDWRVEFDHIWSADRKKNSETMTADSVHG
jgi:hypothetical protein